MVRGWLVLLLVVAWRPALAVDSVYHGEALYRHYNRGTQWTLLIAGKGDDFRTTRRAFRDLEPLLDEGYGYPEERSTVLLKRKAGPRDVTQALAALGSKVKLGDTLIVVTSATSLRDLAGTEGEAVTVDALLAALEPVTSRGIRQVLLLTPGQVTGETDNLDEAISDLPPDQRLETLISHPSVAILSGGGLEATDTWTADLLKLLEAPGTPYLSARDLADRLDGARMHLRFLGRENGLPYLFHLDPEGQEARVDQGEDFWSTWQQERQAAFDATLAAEAGEHDAKKKADAWQAFIDTVAGPEHANPFSTDDDELLIRAVERLRHWQERIPRLPFAEQGIEESERFVRKPGGIILDRENGLMWARRDNRQDIPWHVAKTYAESYHASGYRDWRLPTIDEVKTLHLPGEGRPQRCYPVVNVEVPKLITLTCCCVWTSEERDGHHAAVSLGSDSALRVTWDAPEVTFSRRVLPVRTASEEDY